MGPVTKLGLTVNFWGTRGSVPTPGAGSARIGGNTACVEVLWGKSSRLIFDAGTGIRALGELLAVETGPKRYDIFLSHLHWDHIQGLPFFIPLYVPGVEVHLWGGGGKGVSLDRMMDHQLHSAFFPVGRSQLAADIIYHLMSDQPEELAGGVIRSARINHPGGGYAFRLDAGGRSVVYATDREPDEVSHTEEGKLEPALIDLARGADLLIADAQYTDQEYAIYRKGWGHSCWSDAVRLAQAADAKSLALFHHDPSHTDDFLMEEQKRCRREHPELDVFVAAEGASVVI